MTQQFNVQHRWQFAGVITQGFDEKMGLLQGAVFGDVEVVSTPGYLSFGCFRPMMFECAVGQVHPFGRFEINEMELALVESVAGSGGDIASKRQV
jgi:hypothetical protein